MAKRLLVVDDEPLIVKGLKYSLEQDGYEVDSAEDGQSALRMFRANSYDLIILDLMLPVLDGHEVCSQIRQDSQVPIIMLTAKSSDMDKILGLEYGADDYVTKPFNILELKMRIKTILRRAAAPVMKSDVIEINGMVINLTSRTLTILGQEVQVTAKEFDIMALFASNPGRVFSRQELLEAVWRYDYMGDLRTVDVHIRRLREKLNRVPGAPEYLYTKWGVGYYFAEGK